MTREMPTSWEGADRRYVLDKLGIIGVNTLAAAAFLTVLGVLLTEEPLHGRTLTILGAGILLDLVSEIWLFTEPFQRGSRFLRRLVLAHYSVIGAAYLLLGAAFHPSIPIFYGYAGFTLLWLTAFLIGEAVIVFLHE